MEFTLHRQLKTHFAGTDAQFELSVDGFRVDVVNGQQLVEIQHGPLSAIRDKVRTLLERHQVRVVKPLVVRKQLVKRARKNGKVVSRRRSPRQGTLWDLFDELVYFTRVFPHRRLQLHVMLVEVEEWRYPGHGRRRWRRQNDFQIEDRLLTGISFEHTLHDATDLGRLLPLDLPSPFHTGQLAERLGVPRCSAQRVAYCLRETGAARTVGRLRNTWLYELAGCPNAA
jgi:hypothetical protein